MPESPVRFCKISQYELNFQIVVLSAGLQFVILFRTCW